MDERARLLELIRSNAVNYEHFFAGLEDPNWLDFLAAEGFFRSPPPPEEGDDWVRYPGWPESAYLARVAAAAPERVAEIAEAIPGTDNERVITDLAEIAASLTAAPAARIAERLREWIAGRPLHLNLPHAAASLVSHLAELGQVDAALGLAAEILHIEGQERRGSFEPQTEPVGRIDRWDYSRVLEEMVPALLAADRDRALSLVFDLLALAVTLEAGEGDGDYTYIARPSIADHAQNNDHGLIDVLVVAAREATLAAAADEESMAAVLAALASYDLPIFARLAIHLLTERGTPAEVFAALHNREASASVALWHEYSQLLAHRFADLDTEQREALLELLASEDPDPFEGETAEEAERRRRRRLLERLSMISAELEGPWAETYESLTREFGEPDHPAFLSYVTSFTGPTSPLGVAELTALGPESTLEALATWEPPGGFDGPTPEGLGRALEEAVKTDPRPYAELADRFETLDATYVRSLISGLAGALREERGFAWPALLGLCGWVLAQPYEPEAERGERDRDPGWGWSRKSIADLLTQGLAEGPVEAPISERERIFALIAELAEDPNPTPEHEERYGGSNMDPSTLALNTTRGEAMSALVRYCLWVARREPGDTEVSLESAPEGRDLLERHLDPVYDPSLAIRSVYGRWWGSLFNLDRPWLAAHMEEIFPAAPEEAALFAAAFDAFLAFTYPWPGGFDLLEAPYRIAASRASEGPHSRTMHGDPRTRLGDHLIALRAYGTLDLEAGGIFDLFWSNAPAEIRGAVVRNAGWTVERTENPDPQVFTRLAETWEWIAIREEDEDAREVLDGFGAWLAAPNLDPAWLLQQALAVLGRGIPLDPDFSAYAALPRLAKSDPRSAVAVLRGMVETDRDRWAPLGSREEIRELLTFTLQNPDPAIRAETHHMIDRLIGLGLSDLRDLAEETPQPPEPDG